MLVWAYYRNQWQFPLNETADSLFFLPQIAPKCVWQTHWGAYSTPPDLLPEFMGGERKGEERVWEGGERGEA